MLVNNKRNYSQTEPVTCKQLNVTDDTPSIHSPRHSPCDRHRLLVGLHRVESVVLATDMSLVGI